MKKHIEFKVINAVIDLLTNSTMRKHDLIDAMRYEFNTKQIDKAVADALKMNYIKQAESIAARYPGNIRYAINLTKSQLDSIKVKAA